jgi:hypothetical protein
MIRPKRQPSIWGGTVDRPTKQKTVERILRDITIHIIDLLLGKIVSKNILVLIEQDLEAGRQPDLDRGIKNTDLVNVLLAHMVDSKRIHKTAITVADKLKLCLVVWS